MHLAVSRAIEDVAARKCHQRLDEILIFLPALEISNVVYARKTSNAVIAYTIWSTRIYSKHATYAVQTVSVGYIARLKQLADFLNEVCVKKSSHWWCLVTVTSAIIQLLVCINKVILAATKSFAILYVLQCHTETLLHL